jgi:hypothetical protein
MITLNKNCYYKVKESLEQVIFNHLFADAVINGRVNGQVYVDDVHTPATFISLIHMG